MSKVPYGHVMLDLSGPIADTRPIPCLGYVFEFVLVAIDKKYIMRDFVDASGTGPVDFVHVRVHFKLFRLVHERSLYAFFSLAITKHGLSAVIVIQWRE
jgi:hypothetical protein